MTPADLIRLAEPLQAAGETTQAAALYRAWLNRYGDDKIAAPIHFNHGMLLKCSHPQAAQQAYEKAHALNPLLYQAAVNLGLLLEGQGKMVQALAVWRDALHAALPTEGLCLLLNHLGRLQENRQHLPEAEQHLARSLQLNPHQPDVVQHYLGLRRRQCRWPSLPDWLRQARAGDDVALDIGPFMGMAELPEPARQRLAAQAFVQRKLAPDIRPLPPAPAWQHTRLRIGYFSGDFKHHAVSILMAEVLELHDRQRVEVYGLDYSDPTPSAMRQRVLQAFDRHVPLHTLNDAQAAQCIRDLEIDVLIDLTGLTAGSRFGVLPYRAAPVQASYLGYMGSSAIPGLDHILTDRFLMPPELRTHFSEQPIYLHSYQANDRQRHIGPAPSRAACGLPEHGFVFCAFNNNYKLTPEVWARWMRILQRSPASVLWVLQDNPQARDNLIAHAQSHGVAAERLVFATRCAPEHYLARYHCADLFLDTSPYGAGTTASDALWVGLPVLTHPGPSMVSRMAGSLLQAMGLPELVTDSAQAYEDLAVQLATEPGRIQALKARLRSLRDTSALFDTPRFVRDLEDALIATCRSVAQRQRSAPPSASSSAASSVPMPAAPRQPTQSPTHSPRALAGLDGPSTTTRIKVQGWRSQNHPLALINQFQLLAWRALGVHSLVHEDGAFDPSHGAAPPPNAARPNNTDLPAPNPTQDVATGPAARQLHTADAAWMDALPQQGPFDAVYRILSPLALNTPITCPTVTYLESPWGLPNEALNSPLVQAYFSAGGLIHTPSRWSQAGLVACAMPAERIHVMAPAVHPAYFKPLAAAHRAQLRQTLNYQDEDVVLLHMGPPEWHTGMDLLVKAFALARRKNRHLKLLLQQDAPHSALPGQGLHAQVMAWLQDIGLHDSHTLRAICIVDETMGLQQRNALHNAADAYVTPYRSESFNLPACQAQACGTPVIATQGGATDDFLLSEGPNRFIAGQLHAHSPQQPGPPHHAHIEPELDHLVSLLGQLGRKTSIAPVPASDWRAPAARLLHLLRHAR